MVIMVIDYKDVAISIITLLTDIVELLTGRPISFGPSNNTVEVLKTIINTPINQEVDFSKFQTTSFEENLQMELENSELMYRRAMLQSSFITQYHPLYVKYVHSIQYMLKNDVQKAEYWSQVKLNMSNEFSMICAYINEARTDTDFEIGDSKIRNFLEKYKIG
jgi:hypothetical protein